MGPSFLDSVPNYLGKDYRAAFLGNPLDIMDPLGRIAEPVSGWASHPEPTKTTVWDIKLPNSKCVNFVGSDSPNFDYPKDEPPRYPYMVSWLKLDAVKQFWGENSHEFFSQCLGVMRSGLVARRVITPELCRQHGAHEPAVWKNTDITRVYALDPSYGGEDRCIGGMVEFGESEDGTQIIKVYMPKRYTVIPGQAVKPEDQIAIQLKNDLHAMDIPTRNSFYDPYGKGTLGFSFSQIFGADGPIPIDSGAQATERPVRHDLMIFDLKLREKRLKKCSEHYSKFATEAWFSVRYVIECGQMRDLPMDVMRDGCLREFGNRGSKIEIEGKEKTRDRMGRSPDLFDWCFTGDTEVSTPSGHRRIDSLAPGDEVVTPLGNTTIECVRVRTAKDLVCCSFSDGTSLTGLGEHRIFTRNRGWAALDSLTLVDEIDFESDRFKWQILSRLFTRETPITFKAQADIISAERVAVNRRDFFIESYGCNTVALCLKGIVSIMKMVIGGITASKIFGSLRDRIMPDTTCWSVENFASVLAARFKSLGYYPQNYGTSPKREDAGTLRTQRTSGRITTSQSRVFAKSVEAVTPVSSVGAQSSVLLNAPARTSANVGNSFRRFVSSATRILMRCLTGHRRPVLENVRRFSLPESKLVFNLTLRAHNCYYANGVLAENCAIAVEGCRQRGFKIKNEGGIIVENQREQDEFLERERMYGKFIHDSLLIH